MFKLIQWLMCQLIVQRDPLEPGYGFPLSHMTDRKESNDD